MKSGDQWWRRGLPSGMKFTSARSASERHRGKAESLWKSTRNTGSRVVLQERMSLSAQVPQLDIRHPLTNRRRAMSQVEKSSGNTERSRLDQGTQAKAKL